LHRTASILRKTEQSQKGTDIICGDLAGLVDARGGLARTCVTSTKELTKGSGLT